MPGVVAAQLTRQELAEAVEALDAAASRFVEQREAAEAKKAARRAR